MTNQPGQPPGTSRDHYDDERTTILKSPGAATNDTGSPATDSERLPHSADDEERTTVVLNDDEERTTVILNDDEERTTVVRAVTSTRTPVLGVTGDDRPTDDDEATTLLRSPGAEPSNSGNWDEATTILQATQPDPGPRDPTEIISAASAAGLPDIAELPDAANPGTKMVSARAWFDGRLQDFTAALARDQSGRERPADERQALAAAARDMIVRVGVRPRGNDGGNAAEGWTAESVLQPDQLLANTYFVRALIARGGVGEIYRTRHRDLKTEHAVKILLPHHALDPVLLDLMLEEARLLQRVRHEAVVGCQGLLRDADGRPMLVMDYLRGSTLSARLRKGPLSPAEVAILACRLAEGLGAIHAQGIVHQDISPDNIILADDSCAAATIIDFGVARSMDDPNQAHRSIDFAGKYSWSSPEQLSGGADALDPRSDLYSFGLVLVAAARGQRLDMGQDPETARAARQEVPPLGDIPEPLVGLLRHLLAPAVRNRLNSAADVPGRLIGKRTGLLQRLIAAGSKPWA